MEKSGAKENDNESCDINFHFCRIKRRLFFSKKKIVIYIIRGVGFKCDDEKLIYGGVIFSETKEGMK